MRGADCNTQQFVVESVEQRFGCLGRLGGSDNVDREAFDRKYTRRLNLQQTEAVHAVDGAVLLLAAAFVLRGLCLNYETSDYTQFLTVWVNFFRTHGRLAAPRIRS